MRWLLGCSCTGRSHATTSPPCVIPQQLGSHVHAQKACKAPRRLLVAGAPGTGKTYLVEAIVRRSRFGRVFWLRLGHDMDTFARLIGAVLADHGIVTYEGDAITVLISRCDDPDVAIVIDDFRLGAPHGPLLLDLLQDVRAAVIVAGDLDYSDAVTNRFDGILVCNVIDGLPYDQLQLARGLTPNLDSVNPAQRRLAQTIAVLDDVVPESLLLSVEGACDASALELVQAGVLQFTAHQQLAERGAVLSGTVRRQLRAGVDRQALVAAANAIRICWTRKTSSRRWALSLITHGEALAEFFTEALLGRDVTEHSFGAFCDHLTMLGTLYIYALSPRHALCSFKTSLSLISSLPLKQTSHYLCMMRTLHCMANVYGSIGDSEGQNRALSSAFAIDSQLRRSDLGMRLEMGSRSSRRKPGRHRLRNKLRSLTPGASHLIDLGDGFRQHSFTPSHDDVQNQIKKESLLPPAA